MQTELELGQVRQHGIEFAITLAEKYQPQHVRHFIGMPRVKRFMCALLKKPRPCSLLYIGPPGSGKSTMAMAFAADLPGALHHIPAQKCDVLALDAIWDRLHYLPAKGRWHIVQVDEADKMTEGAQLQLLSRMDAAASLKPVWGGGFERGEPMPVIWIFTANGTGPEQIRPPVALVPRFLSRCMILPFEPPKNGQLSGFLKAVWKQERGRGRMPSEFFVDLASGVGVRDALMRLNTELLSPRSNQEILREIEAKREAAEAKANGETTPDEDELHSKRSDAAKRAWETMRKRYGR